MNKWMIALVVALGIAGGNFTVPTPASAQTLYETLNLARDAEAAATKMYDSADKLLAMIKNFAANEPLKAMAPSETALFDERAKAARTAMLRQANAYELMAIRLRAHARTLR